MLKFVMLKRLILGGTIFGLFCSIDITNFILPSKQEPTLDEITSLFSKNEQDCSILACRCKKKRKKH